MTYDNTANAYIKMLTESVTAHPERDERGHTVTIHAPDKTSPTASWRDPAAHAMITPGHTVLDDSPKFNSDKPDWNDSSLHGDFAEPEINNPSRKPLATGVVIHEDDGRVWVVHPTNQFGGYTATFPKGKVDTGVSPRANAIKEAWEESGLAVKLTGHAADTERSTSFTRYYHAKRIGGSPKHMGWESQAVSLVPKSILHKVADHYNDSKVVKAAQEK